MQNFRALGPAFGQVRSEPDHDIASRCPSQRVSLQTGACNVDKRTGYRCRHLDLVSDTSPTSRMLIQGFCQGDTKGPDVSTWRVPSVLDLRRIVRTRLLPSFDHFTRSDNTV